MVILHGATHRGKSKAKKRREREKTIEPATLFSVPFLTQVEASRAYCGWRDWALFGIIELKSTILFTCGIDLIFSNGGRYVAAPVNPTQLPIPIGIEVLIIYYYIDVLKNYFLLRT
jgi:hypothetical protein